MTAAHGGYRSDDVPLGGAAAVCERLCQAWCGRSDLEVTLYGPGPIAPPGVRYQQIDLLGGRLPSALTELEHARFSRRFERQVTDRILAEEHSVVLSHDISEGPNFGRLTRHGLAVMTVFHVDVVDYFNRFYLGDLVPPWWLTRLHAALPGWFPMPDLLGLVFDKQAQAVAHSTFLLLPSSAMQTVLERCYPQMPRGRAQIVPWGSPQQQPAASEVERAKAELRARWGLTGSEQILLTLSRISPEKSQDRLLEALEHGSRAGQLPSGLTVVIAGGPAYMRGQRFLRQLQQRAENLPEVRVIFPGHLGGPYKRAAFELAHIFLSPSRHESYGLSILEAMAAGCPIVATPSYGARATVDPSCGVVLPLDRCQPQALWEALGALLRDPARRAQLGQGALARARSETFEQAADRMLELASRLPRRSQIDLQTAPSS